ncbi:hypothetical protein [Dankookia sp. P2]|uniref:hypothetical protein n=1 Tax=Dankookia sp. P2 TaxID=3423955 RepID=UPI003D66C8FF
MTVAPWLAVNQFLGAIEVFSATPNALRMAKTFPSMPGGWTPWLVVKRRGAEAGGSHPAGKVAGMG